MLPSLATRVKYRLGIQNPNCVAYDILFGCPGWIEGVIQAQAFIKSGIATKVLVIGAETLSRVVDKFDRDSMIYSDGAGACVVEKNEGQNSGIIGHASQTFGNRKIRSHAHFCTHQKCHHGNCRKITRERISCGTA